MGRMRQSEYLKGRYCDGDCEKILSPVLFEAWRLKISRGDSAVIGRGEDLAHKKMMMIRKKVVITKHFLN